LEAAALPMSYTPVPAGGIEPPHDGATTRCLPTWLSRRLARRVGVAAARKQGWSRKQGSNLRLTRRMKPPLYRLSYSALDDMWLPSWVRTKPPGIKARCPTSYAKGKVWSHVRDLNPRFPI
jgi:hypothetical protein